MPEQKSALIERAATAQFVAEQDLTKMSSTEYQSHADSVSVYSLLFEFQISSIFVMLYTAD